ncbi:hypothetical protein J437_LFUL018797 [Ladona fulva]|uniref:RRM domain-containing protein n=1 Tax=Ladona fulva TaxID=123851 RepID=A0A8K0KR30_LADFU|nr:hypothetical protein J437_LFUL018797 [Ladona fulva]
MGEVTQGFFSETFTRQMKISCSTRVREKNVRISMHKGYAFVQFTNPFDARSACLGEDGRTVLGQTLVCAKKIGKSVVNNRVGRRPIR